MIFQTIEMMAGLTMYPMYDTISSINGGVYVVDGKVQWTSSTPNDLKIAQLFNDWLGKGIIDPEWESYVNNESVDHNKFDTQYLFIQATSNGAAEHDTQLFATNPNAKVGWLPATKPVLNRSQVIHLGDSLSRVGGTVTGISQKCKNIPLAVTWCDWKYSEDGIFLNTFGVEGVSFTYDANGEPQLTDLVAKNPQMSLTMLATLYMQNTFGDPGLKLAYGQWQFEGSKVPDAFEEWGKGNYDDAYTWPRSAIVFTPEQQTTINSFTTDIGTYITENFTLFISGQKPFSEYESYVSALMDMGLATVISTYQAAYDTYLANQTA
jgi:putative aldouronate transport system substrate-binding protein